MPAEHDPAATAKVDSPSPAEAIAAFALRVSSGPDAGKTFNVSAKDPLPALVGQSPVCAIRLADDSVSRRHLELDIDARGLRIKDLGSTNGTSVDGVSVTEAYVRPGQSIRIGKSVISVAREGREPLPATTRTSFGRFVGASPEIRRLYPLFDLLASRELCVVIEGETGTGKELLAETVHEQSARAQGPFVVLDCGIPAAELEEQVLGRAGADPRKGLFEQAATGTLVIDRLAQLGAEGQALLLRVIERGEGLPRLIVTSDRDLDNEVRLGRLREDLYHRLAVTRIELPPLRKRRGDIEVLATHFWRELGGHGSLDAALVASWNEYPWPGNVRELRNAVTRVVVLGALDSAEASDLRDATDAEKKDELATLADRFVSDKLPLVKSRQIVVERFERLYLARMLEANGGNVSRAAIAAGIGRRYFQILRARQRQGSGD